MGKFDLSNAADFSRLTQQTLGTINSLLGGRDPSEWNIVEASYNGVVFHVFESKQAWEGALPRVTDFGGRRKVKYQFPYRDGQTTDDLGRRPGSFEMEIVLFGPRYQEGYRALMAEFDKPTPGKLKHPMRGEIKCVVEEVVVSHVAEQRKAATLRVTFIEHNFTIGNIRDLRDSSVKGALAAALAVFKIVDAAIKDVEKAQLISRLFKNRIKALLGKYKATSAKSLAVMNQTFNRKGGSADIPSLLPVNQGGTRNADGSLATDTFIVARSISDPFNSIPVETLSGATLGTTTSSSAGSGTRGGGTGSAASAAAASEQLSETTLIAIAVTEIEKDFIARREELTEIIAQINAGGGALEMYETILELKQTAVLLQDVLEKGIASSNARILDYTVPRLMSLREAAFLNGLTPERVQELDILNPSLLSVNYIESGTVIKVPSV